MKHVDLSKSIYFISSVWQ